MERAIQSEISSIGPDERRVDVPRINHLKQSSSSSSSSSSSDDFSYGMESHSRHALFRLQMGTFECKNWHSKKVKSKSRVENKIHQNRNRRGARYQSLTIERIKRGNTFKHASFFETKAIQ